MQPPESPIPDSLWINVFRVSTAVAATVTLWSLWRSSHAARGSVAPFLAVLRRSSASEEDVEKAVDDINAVLEQELRAKQGCGRLAVVSNTALLLSHLRSDRKNPAIVTGILNIIRKCVVGDEESRVAFNKAEGCKRVMIALVQAFNAGNIRLVEDAAHTLKELTAIDEEDMVLPYDVPVGSEGTYQLAALPVVVNMLKNLESSHTTQPLLIATTGFYAHLVTLQRGAKAIAKGVDGRSGVSFFLSLIEANANVLVTEHCLRCVRWIATHVRACHEELSAPPNVHRIMSVMQLNRDKASLLHVLELCLAILKDAVANDRTMMNYFMIFFEGNGGAAVFEMFTRSSQQQVREKAAELIYEWQQRSEPFFGEHVRRLMDQYRKAIQERRQQDEQQRRMQQQQQRQQQMMLQQMMMGGGGGGDGGGMGDDE